MKLEICCGSYADAVTAHKNGADRIELCASIYFGGLTPSVSSLTLLKERTGAKAAVMVRPREGGFCYNDEELSVMLRDSDEFIRRGADALVFGFLTPDGFIDTEKTKRFMAMIDGRCDSVFHKAFDVCKNELVEGAELLKSIGITRILTAGKEKTALMGAQNLKRLMAVGGIGILPCGSVRAHNLAEIAAKTGADWAHTSAFEPCFDNSAHHDSIFFTPSNAPMQGEYPRTNGDVVKEIVNIARGIV